MLWGIKMKKNKKETSAEDEITKSCALCEKASLLAGTDYVLCCKYGVVNAGNSCRKFIFDPLKRVPHAPLSLPEEDGGEEEEI